MVLNVIIFSPCFEQIVNTTSEELSNVAIEASVWDLDGTCPYYKTFEKLSVPPKKTVSIVEMKYPKSKNPKPVYFLLLKLYYMSDNRIISRNFYWLHLSGGDYKLLESYKKKKIPLKIISKIFIKGSTYEVHMNVQNTSKKPGSQTVTLANNFTSMQSDNDFDSLSLESTCEKPDDSQAVGLVQKIFRRFSKEQDVSKVTETNTNGTDEGVAFFLHFSVHASVTQHKKEGEDTRILPVHYSDNYFSLVPGEGLPVKLTFEVPPGVTPRVTLRGWNYPGAHTVH